MWVGIIPVGGRDQLGRLANVSKQSKNGYNPQKPIRFKTGERSNRTIVQEINNELDHTGL
jgi:hypothetical protein